MIVAFVISHGRYPTAKTCKTNAIGNVIRAIRHVRKIENNNINIELFFFCLFFVIIISLRSLFAKKGIRERKEKSFEIFLWFRKDNKKKQLFGDEKSLIM